MVMPNNNMPITDFKNLTDTDRSLIIWQGLTDTWAKLQETIDHQKEIEADTKVHDRLLVTGNGEPSLLERMRSVERFVSGFNYWAKFIGGALIIQTITFGLAIAIALIRFLPVLERLANNP